MKSSAGYGSRKCAPGCTCRRHQSYGGGGSPGPRREPLQPTDEKTCTRCGETKTIAQFTLSRPATETRNAVYRPWCKTCQSEAAKQWFRDNPERTKANALRQKLRKLYGLTVEQYEAILASQGGGCGICGAEVNANGHRLAVDHDHDTNHVRGILCHRCNRAIGLLGDDVELLKKAIYYLEEAGSHGPESDGVGMDNPLSR